MVNAYRLDSYAVTITLTELQGTPLLSTHYANSTVTSFTLQDFYFGCAVNLGQGAVGIPAQCLVEVTGKMGRLLVPGRLSSLTRHMQDTVARTIRLPLRSKYARSSSSSTRRPIWIQRQCSIQVQ